MLEQSCRKVLMVRPAAFGYNPQTAGTNSFQQAGASHDPSLALDEFDAMVNLLRDEGVEVLVYNDTPEPAKPDAVFPNNWLGVHPHGLRVYYPMLAPNRKIENHPNVIQFLDQHIPASQIIDLNEDAADGEILEGTGSLIFDYFNKRVFASRSARTHEGLVRKVAAITGFEAIVFDALDASNQPYYHTNVLLSIGTRYAIICAEAIPETQRQTVLDALEYSGRTLVLITREQVAEFAGNVLEITNQLDEQVIVISSKAVKSLRDEQIAVLNRSGLLIEVDIPTIETIGGGSVRCMMAEIWD